MREMVRSVDTPAMAKAVRPRMRSRKRSAVKARESSVTPPSAMYMDRELEWSKVPGTRW